MHNGSCQWSQEEQWAAAAAAAGVFALWRFGKRFHVATPGHNLVVTGSRIPGGLKVANGAFRWPSQRVSEIAAAQVTVRVHPAQALVRSKDGFVFRLPYTIVVAPTVNPTTGLVSANYARMMLMQPKAEGKQEASKDAAVSNDASTKPSAKDDGKTDSDRDVLSPKKLSPLEQLVYDLSLGRIRSFVLDKDAEQVVRGDAGIGKIENHVHEMLDHSDVFTALGIRVLDLTVTGLSDNSDAPSDAKYLAQRAKIDRIRSDGNLANAKLDEEIKELQRANSLKEASRDYSVRHMEAINKAGGFHKYVQAVLLSQFANNLSIKTKDEKEFGEIVTFVRALKEAEVDSNSGSDDEHDEDCCGGDDD